MPKPYLTDEEVEDRLNGERNLMQSLFVGRAENFIANRAQKNQEEQSAMIAAARFLPMEQVAKAYGVDKEHLINLVRQRGGSIGTEDVQTAAQNKVDQIKDKGLSKLIECMDILDVKPLESDPIKVATVAEKLSNIIHKISPAEEKNTQTNVQVNVFTPRVNNADDYDVIEVKGNPRS